MTDWILHLIDASGYWGIFLLMVLENIFPPIPSEFIMGIGGIRVGQGRMAMEWLLLSGTIGSTLGNYAWFLVGHALGFRRLRPLVDRWGRWATLEWRDIEKLDRVFARYGPVAVFVFRFMPAFRTMISLPAGLFRMGHVRFLLWTAAGAFIWNVILAYAGYVLGRNFAHIDHYLGPAATIFIVIALIAYVWRLVRWKPRTGA